MLNFKNILIVLFLIIPIILLSQAPKDVSEQLDIYSRIKWAVEAGVMDVDNSGNFNGTNVVNRYELAGTIFGFKEYLLNLDLFKGVSTILTRTGKLEQENQSQQTSLDTLRRRLDAFEMQFSSAELIAIESRLNGIKTEIMMEMQTLEDKTSFISGYSDFLVAVENELKNLYSTVKEMESRLTASEANVGRLLEYLRKYEKLDTWMGEVETDLKALSDKDSSFQYSLLQIDVRLKNVELMDSRMRTIQEEWASKEEAVSNAALIPAIIENQKISESKIIALEIANKQIGILTQDLDYMKIEYDRLKNEMNETRKQFWYAMGLSVGAGLIAIAGILYTYSISGSMQQ